jgi:predicted Rdx family selenoprotein|tara:strand:- start:662 stop:835 length:174 start_codon:yes stop_codon:yes gene_type:complete
MAARLAADIRNALPSAKVALIPGGKGDFIVVANGRELWNKRQVGRFPEHAEILDELK